MSARWMSASSSPAARTGPSSAPATPYTAPGQIGVGTDGTNTFIILNDGNSPNDGMAIQISGVHNVDASWFVL